MKKRLHLSLILVANLSISLPALAWSDLHSSNNQSKGPTVPCTPLPDSVDIPIRYDVSFEGDIRPLIGTLCLNCHINSSSGGLNINTSNARINLIGATETGAPSTITSQVLRVVPFNPQESFFFLKLNCTPPPELMVGSRMPLGGSEAPLALQALVYDWIASGALMPNSPGADRLFIANFESITRETP